MMSNLNRSIVKELIASSIDAVNSDLPKDMQLRFTEDAALMGPGHEIDSLGLMMLLAAVEDLAANQFGLTLKLGQDEDMASPDAFNTVGSLIDHVWRKLSIVK